MFDFLKKVKTYSSCNTDINYLEEKEEKLKELKGIKERIINAVCEINEDFRYQRMYLINLLNTPFIPKNIQNYSEESQQYFKNLKEMEQQFENIMSIIIDEILMSDSKNANYIRNLLNAENIKIEYCKNKYPEASRIPFLICGSDINLCQKEIELALLNFYASKEYVEVLQRYRTECLKR